MLLLATVLAGCGGAATAAATEVPVVSQAGEDTVVAEAVIEPAQWNDVRFDIPGIVAEVLVQEGDTVAAGDPLARLDSASLERAVAQAETALRQAEIALEQLQEPAEEADVRRAENTVAQAAAALSAAQLSLQAVQNSALLNEALEDAQQAYDDAKERYEISLARYNRGEIDYWYVDHDQQIYEDAQLALERVQQQGDAQQTAARNEVQRAVQAHQEAQDALARLQEGADVLAVESAEVAVQAAQVALDEARSNLEQATLQAPFAGTAAAVNVKVGDVVAAGQNGFVVATLDQLQARTTDLTELDVARVAVNRPATVTVDALPGQEFGGVVDEIALQAGDYRGDVVYAVTVVLNDVGDAPLRWGMTALVEIDTGQ
jgi:multidrug efflux pump subunit AcrA (membrane-fusion protein)